MARTKKKTETRRGSPEAIAKRRVARALNRLFDGAGTTEALDGRTLKRKQRLLGELKEGKGGKALKALEVLVHSNELLALGESLSTLRKLKPMLPATPPINEQTAAVYAETQKNYGFDPRAWKVLGVDIDKLTGGGGDAAPVATRKAPRKRK